MLIFRPGDYANEIRGAQASLFDAPVVAIAPDSVFGMHNHFVVPTTGDIDAALRNHVRIWRHTRMWRRFPEELARFDREYYGGLKRERERLRVRD